MFFTKNIKIEIKYQGFIAKEICSSPDNTSTLIEFTEEKRQQEVMCPSCLTKSYIFDYNTVLLKICRFG